MSTRTAELDRVEIAALVAIAEGLGSSLPVEPLAFSGDDRRRHARLLETEVYEAWLIAWSSAADLELHDHGGSQGAFRVVEGTLMEARSDLLAPRPLDTAVLVPGDTRQVTVTSVHRVWNPGPGEALSVHVYSPPLTSMTFFDDKPGFFLNPVRTERVDGNPEGGSAR